MIWTLSERAIRHDRLIAALERQVPKDIPALYLS